MDECLLFQSQLPLPQNVILRLYITLEDMLDLSIFMTSFSVQKQSDLDNKRESGEFCY